MMVEHRLKVRAPAPLPDELVADLRRHKAQIMALLLDRKAAWTPEDWRTFFDERAGAAKYERGVSQEVAEATAFEVCVVRWLDSHPPSQDDLDCCVQCGEQIAEFDDIPCLTGDGGHVWIHGQCHPAWLEERRTQAGAGAWRASLALFGR